MIPRLNWRRVVLVSTGLILGLTATVSARAATVLTADSVQKLVVVEDNANFLTQVALMVAQLPKIKGLTSDEQSGLIEGSWSDVQTAAEPLPGVQTVAGTASLNKAVAGQLKNAGNLLAADITALGVAVTANPLSAATQKAFKKMGQDAQNLENVIKRIYAVLPVASRPVELSIDPAAGQARVFAVNATVRFVLSGPKVAITGGNGTWALTSGRQDPTEPPLSTPFSSDGLSGSSASARQAMQATATQWGAWTYIYYQYGVRRPTLLLLNVGAPGGNLTGGNATDGGSLGAGDLGTSGASLDVNSDNTLVISGNISNGSITKSGPGIWALNGTNTYSGGTNINGGTLVFSSLNNLGTGNINFNGGTLQWASGTTTDISNQTIFLGGGATLDTNGNNVTLSSPLGGNGTGALTKTGNGILTLTANATYTGTTTVTAGTLQVTSTYLPPGDIFVVGTGTFEYAPDANDSLVVNAMPVDGSAYPWGNSTYEVDAQEDGSWVLPALNAQIVSVAGGYEILPWNGTGEDSADSILVSPENSDLGYDQYVPIDSFPADGLYDLIDFNSGPGLDLGNLTLSNPSAGLSYTFSSTDSGAITLTIAPNTTTVGGSDGSN